MESYGITVNLYNTESGIVIVSGSADNIKKAFMGNGITNGEDITPNHAPELAVYGISVYYPDIENNILYTGIATTVYKEGNT